MIVCDDANLSTGANLNIFVTQDGKLSTGASLDVKSATNTRIHAQGILDIKSDLSTRFAQGETLDINATGAIKVTGPTIDLNPSIPAATAAEAVISPIAKSAEDALFPVRVPEHEPWLGHEHLDPKVFTAQNTRATAQPSYVIRNTAPPIESAADERKTTTQWREAANTKTETVNGKQVDVVGNGIVAGQEGTVGKQPRKPDSPSNMEGYFLDRLCTELNLQPYLSASSGGNAEAVAMAMAQIKHECNFIPRSESLNYSADSLLRVFDYRLKLAAAKQYNKDKRQVTRADKVRIANAIARKPATIGNTMYGGRYGNGVNQGYLYRGRGMIQITFKDNYTKYCKLAGHPEVIQDPDLANDPIIATNIAIAYMKSKSISWSSSNISALATEFQDAVGYADKRNETPKRLKTGRGYLYDITNQLIPRITSLTLEKDGTNVKADPVKTPDTFNTKVKGAR
jgi:putative chitinase